MLSSAVCSSLLMLREYVPLKQGLRHELLLSERQFVILREYVPLKQGLRLSVTS